MGGNNSIRNGDGLIENQLWGCELLSNYCIFDIRNNNLQIKYVFRKKKYLESTRI